MRQQEVNLFSEGLNLDTNPIAMSNKLLSDALNATMITMNGNELVLQNDMGNARVEFAHLPSGFVPVGMKEHGGIVYVASHNPLTNQSLIGCFPSPERNISRDESGLSDLEIANFSEVNDIILKCLVYEDFRPGDKYYIKIAVKPEEDSKYYENLKFNIEKSLTKFSMYIMDSNNSLIEIENDGLQEEFLVYKGNVIGNLYAIFKLNIPDYINYPNSIYKDSNGNINIEINLPTEYSKNIEEVDYGIYDYTIDYKEISEISCLIEDNKIILIIPYSEDLNTFTYTITPKFRQKSISDSQDYDEIILTQLAHTETIDLSLIGSDDITISNFAYYVNEVNSTLLLKYNIQAYLPLNQYISNITFKYFNYNKLKDLTEYSPTWSEYSLNSFLGSGTIVETIPLPENGLTLGNAYIGFIEVTKTSFKEKTKPDEDENEGEALKFDSETSSTKSNPFFILLSAVINNYYIDGKVDFINANSEELKTLTYPVRVNLSCNTVDSRGTSSIVKLVDNDGNMEITNSYLLEEKGNKVAYLGIQNKTGNVNIKFNTEIIPAFDVSTMPFDISYKLTDITPTVTLKDPEKTFLFTGYDSSAKKLINEQIQSPINNPTAIYDSTNSTISFEFNQQSAVYAPLEDAPKYYLIGGKLYEPLSYYFESLFGELEKFEGDDAQTHYAPKYWMAPNLYSNSSDWYYKWEFGESQGNITTSILTEQKDNTSKDYFNDTDGDLFNKHELDTSKYATSLQYFYTYAVPAFLNKINSKIGKLPKIIIIQGNAHANSAAYSSNHYRSKRHDYIHLIIKTPDGKYVSTGTWGFTGDNAGDEIYGNPLDKLYEVCKHIYFYSGREDSKDKPFYVIKDNEEATYTEIYDNIINLSVTAKLETIGNTSKELKFYNNYSKITILKRESYEDGGVKEMALSDKIPTETSEAELAIPQVVFTLIDNSDSDTVTCIEQITLNSSNVTELLAKMSLYYLASSENIGIVQNVIDGTKDIIMDAKENDIYLLSNTKEYFNTEALSSSLINNTYFTYPTKGLVRELINTKIHFKRDGNRIPYFETGKVSSTTGISSEELKNMLPKAECENLYIVPNQDTYANTFPATNGRYGDSNGRNLFIIVPTVNTYLYSCYADN